METDRHPMAAAYDGGASFVRVGSLGSGGRWPAGGVAEWRREREQE